MVAVGRPPLTRVGGNAELELAVAVRVFERMWGVGGRGGWGAREVWLEFGSSWLG